MASDRAKDLVVAIAEILNPIVAVFEDDMALVYSTFDDLAEFIEKELVGEELAD